MFTKTDISHFTNYYLWGDNENEVVFAVFVSN